MDADAIFATTFQGFHDALPDDQKKLFVSYPNAQSMIEAVETQVKSHPIHDTRLTACMTRLNAFVQRVAPFCDVINILVQTHPEYAGLVWGAIRLIFLLGSNYITFLEKLSDMFTTLKHIIPAYEEYATKLRDRFQGSSASQPRLMKALSYLYSDIVQFCGEACRLLSSKKGIRFQATLLRKFCWKPFDLRFGDLLTRVKKHMQFLELEMSVSHMTISLDHYAKYEQDLQKTTEKLIEHDTERREKAETFEMQRRFKRLKKSIVVHRGQDLFHGAIQRQVPGTGYWLFESSIYREWFEASNPIQSTHDIIMFFGKPGYGKTHLCATLIENLLKMPQPASYGNRPRVFFHFFDKLQPETCRSQVAFRIILSQILDFCDMDKDAIDIASLAMYKHHGSGWLYVSQEEVMVVMKILLEKIGVCYLVFDGVDECIDNWEFFQSLNDITSACDHSKIALFSRPDARLPKSIMDRTSRIFLSSSQNTGDIQSFALQRIKELADEQILPSNRDPTEIAFEIATRADGMFLWAYLLIEYLQCDGLSTQERLEALDGMVILEGLENIYARILEKLYRNPQKVRANVRRAFQWTVGALRPLTINELSIAITSIPGKSTLGSDEIPNLNQRLGRFSGSLLEENQDGTVRFIHSSVKEFLQNSATKPDATESIQEFGVAKSPMLLYLARTSIAYMESHVPVGPLSGSSQVTPSKSLTARKYPFLNYCLESWQKHICALMDYARSQPRASFPECNIPELAVELMSFIQNQKRVTTWIESSWLFGVRPSVTKLSSAAGALRHSMGRVTDKNIVLEDLASTLQLLARDLEKLSSAWDEVLSTTPNEIWEPSLLAFTPSNFWVGTQDAQVTRFTVSHCHDQISTLLQTQSSEDGLEIGVVKLLMPRSIVDQYALRSLERTSAGWRIAYEVWSVETASIKFSAIIGLSPEDIAPLLITAMWDSTNDTILRDLVVDIPVTMSPTLRKLVVMSSLITMTDINRPSSQSETPVNCSFIIQPLDLWYACTFAETECSHRVLAHHLVNLVPPHHGLLDTSLGKNAYPYGCLFNPAGTVMMLLRPGANNGGVRPQEYLDRISNGQERALELSVLGQVPNGTIFKHLSTMMIQLNLLPAGSKDMAGMSGMLRFIAFHPTLPILLWGQRNEMIAWQYLVQDLPPTRVCSYLLEQLTFSTCGRYLHGRIISPRYEFAIVDLFVELGLLPRDTSSRLTETPQDRAAVNANRPHDFPELSGIVSAENSAGSNLRTMMKRFVAEAPPSIQKSNGLLFGQTIHGGVEVSLLKHIQEGDAIVLHTLCEDGTARSETLSRLPESMRSTEAVLLSPFKNDGSDTIHLVLHKKLQLSYQLGQQSNGGAELPAVIQRTRKSIPTIVAQNNMLAEFIADGNRRRSSVRKGSWPTKRIRL